MTTNELKNNRYYLMKHQQYLSSINLLGVESYVDDIIVMNGLINEINDEITIKEKK